jgi:anti-sigma regulatory factor (Ser/Thr protein kinase)
VVELALQMSLPRTATASRDAWHDLGSWIPSRCGPSASEAALLLTSELVTNVVVHTDSVGVDVRAHCDGVRLRVCVDDDAMTPLNPVQRGGPEPPAGGGRGLWLLQALAAHWGCQALPDGKRVWFEVACGEAPGTAGLEPLSSSAAIDER